MTTDYVGIGQRNYLSIAAAAFLSGALVTAAVAQGYRPPNERPVDIALLKFICESSEPVQRASCAYLILGIIQGLNRSPTFDCLDENKNDQGAMKDAVVAAIKKQVIVNPMQRTPASEFVIAVLVAQFPCLGQRRQAVIPPN